MKRANGWEMRLYDLIEAARYKPFAWGSHDCCTFALECHLALTGEVAFVPNWHDYDSAIVVLKEKSVSQMATEWFGNPVDGWATARRGDVVLIDASRRHHFAVECLGVVASGAIAVLGEHNLDFIPVRDALKTWRIG